MISEDLLTKRVVRGVDQVIACMADATPLLGLPFPGIQSWISAKVIAWLIDSFDAVAELALGIVSAASDLRRFTIYTFEPESVAQLAANPRYSPIFEHPAVHILVLGSDAVLDLDAVVAGSATESKVFSQEVRLLVSLDPSRSDREELETQFIRLHRAAYTVAFPDDVTSWLQPRTMDILMGFDHLIKNLEPLLSRPDLRNAEASLKGRPAILVGAGPSAAAHFDFLAKMKGKALILAADTILTPLCEAGIDPDIVVAIERVPEIVPLLDLERSHDKTLLCGGPYLDPECYRTYKGPYSVSFVGSQFIHWLPFSRLGFGISASCMELAIAIALFMECSPLYLVGMDLCWGDDGAPYSQGVSKLEIPEFLEVDKSRKKDEAIKVANIAGKPVWTTDTWLRFRLCFEQLFTTAQGPIYNLSPIGLPMAGTTPLGVEDVPIPSGGPKSLVPELLDRLPYIPKVDGIAALRELRRRADESLIMVEALQEHLPHLNLADTQQLLRECPAYPSLIEPIFGAANDRLLHPDADLADAARGAIVQGMPLLASSLEQVEPIAEDLILKAQAGTVSLY